MPPKSCRKRRLERNLKKAREAKSRRESDDQRFPRSVQAAALVDDEAVELPVLLQSPDDLLNTDDELEDPSFDLNASMKSDKDYLIHDFCDSWILQLGKDDRVNLGLFLCFQLEKVLAIGCTKAAEYAALMIGRNEQTVRQWRAKFFDNDGAVLESKQGKYQRSGILWFSESLYVCIPGRESRWITARTAR